MAEPLPSLSITPNILSVSAKVGTTSSEVVSVTNIGTADVMVTQAIINGTGFSVTGLTTPMSLASDQSKSFTVKFTAPTVGSVNGSLTIVTDVRHRPVVLSLHGSAATASPGVSSVAVTPVQATPAPSTRVQFTAAVQGTTTNDSVTWTTSMGSISPTGVYTAPARASIGTVTATSVADPTKSASAVVMVAAVSAPIPAPTPVSPTPEPTGPAVSSVLISPATTSTTTGATISFTATVLGSTSDKAVTWHASSGSITSTGVYTAPSTAGTSVVTAASVADPAEVATATITVTAAPAGPTTPSVTSVTVLPATASLSTSGAMTFTASVQGTTTNKSVTWTAALGSISSSGAYTAPASAGTDTVTATSEANSSKSASATVTVTAPVSTPPATPPTQTATCGAGASGCPAFPGAMGGGASTVGGRGGSICEVTNTNDSGAGSLRSCVAPANCAPRTVIFRVGGIISQQSPLQISCPFITIAGQTAPGGGVVLGGTNQNGQALYITTNDVVVRYLTVDGYDPSTPTGPDTGTVGIELGSAATNVVIDHVSLRWCGNKCYITYTSDSGTANVIHDDVLQWSTLYEPDVLHPVGPMTDTAWGQGLNINLDFHHNYFANIGHRIPLDNTDQMRWVSNLVFNWCDPSAQYGWASEPQGSNHMDLIDNLYVAGNMNVGCSNPHPVNVDPIHSSDCTANCLADGSPSIYMSGNVGPQGTDYALSCEVGSEGGDETDCPIGGAWERTTPLPSETIPIVPDANPDTVILPTVGNSQMLSCTGTWTPRRDSQDTRIVQEYPNGTGQLFSGQFTQPAVASGTPCAESLNDGIPDQWKSLNGFSTTDPNLFQSTAPNGYTYLENYLNGPN